MQADSSFSGDGGTADLIAGKFLDDGQLVKIIGEKDPRAAVEKALHALKNWIPDKKCVLRF
ncbi:hypothetical protein KAI12_03465 [Candidatus Bathyarchaeota archaeon]|nr:hypothetical protein [Candidatus Bathyarchaeota archaeon]